MLLPSHGKADLAAAAVKAAGAHGPGGKADSGDLFASVLLGASLRGETLADATARAVDFIQKCVSRTLAAGTPVLDGVQFEPLLKELV